MCKQCAQCAGVHLLTDDDAGWTSALEILVAVLVCLAACEGHDLGSHVCAELLLAGATLDYHISIHLVFLKSYKLQRNNVGSLV